MRKRRILCWSVLALGLSFSAIRAAEPGTITGRVDMPGEVTAISAIDRSNDKKFPGKIDAKTGTFTISGLPAGAKYDLILDVGTVRLEGVNFKVPHSDFEEEQPQTKEDREALDKIARHLNKFENEIDVMAIVGNVQHAAVLLNKRRTTAFINSNPGEMVWRLELWHFEKPDDTWIKVQDELAIVLYRQRLQKSEFAKKALTLDPALGGIEVSDKQPSVDVGKVELPGKEPGIRLRMKKDK
jgi:hypothetical protein